jgi:hypothetical protein
MPPGFSSETMDEISEYAAPGLRERLRHVYWVGGRD